MADFSGFDPYKLSGVTVTDHELGRGSYATILELEHFGLKCAGKKIHEVLLGEGDTSYSICRFGEECHLLSQVRHPNIVQFLGVHFQRGTHIPILVMEFLPTNLSSCIEQYNILPNEISYSILCDVALGLCYLHNQSPSIVHRDLSANNVLLTADMTAKISDLGVARIINLTPQQASRMTQNPGTPAYMPPEVMVPEPKYDTSVDIFSYGILMIHVLSGRWPEPQEGQIRNNECGEMIPVSEAERRDVFLQRIGNDHPLMNTIQLCIKNDPKSRPHISEIVRQTRIVSSQVSFTFPSKVEILRHFQLQGHRPERRTDIEQQTQTATSLSEEVQTLNSVHASQVELELMQNRIRDLSAQNQSLVSRRDAEWSELKANVETLELEKRQLDAQLAEERKTSERLAGEIQDLQSEVMHTKSDVRALQCTKLTLEASISRNDATLMRKDAEIEADKRVLKEKETIISGMNKQLNKTREYLAMNQQVLTATITWKECAHLPTKVSEAKTTVINGKVYCGGGVTEAVSDANTVYCYDVEEDKWTGLPPLPVRFFGLGRINSTLVAVGGTRMNAKGMKKGITNEVYTYNEQLQKWDAQTIPPMPTARQSPGVLSLESGLIVASGYTADEEFANTVEIFQPNASQWYETDPLLIDCCDVSLVANGSQCFVVGGFKEPTRLNQVLYASVDDLLHNAHAVPASQTTHSTNRDHVTQTAWKKLPDTPDYRPASAMLAGYILAVGGSETSEGGADSKAVYAYSPQTECWIHISNMPLPLCEISVNTLSPVEILVIGGQNNNCRRNETYKGTLNLKL